MLPLTKLHLEGPSPMSVFISFIGFGAYFILGISRILSMPDNLMAYLSYLSNLFLIFGIIVVGIHGVLIVLLVFLLSKRNSLWKLPIILILFLKNIIDMAFLLLNVSRLLDAETTNFLTFLCCGLILIFINFFLIDQIYFSNQESFWKEFVYMFICCGNVNCLASLGYFLVESTILIFSEISATSIISLTGSIAAILSYGVARWRIGKDSSKNGKLKF